MKITRRTHIINYLIKNNSYERYLEIGVRNPNLNFNKIKCKYKEGIDPNPDSCCKYVMTSDEFFKTKAMNKTYDIVFIDGLHLCDQVLKDVKNSLEHLSDNGVIVLHDCNPIKKKHQEANRGTNKKWNGTVWKAFAILRMTMKDLDMYVVDVNQGCGVIKKGTQKLFKKVSKDELKYSFLKKNRKKLLRLCSVSNFLKREFVSK